jgi:hypothetical protein
MSSRKTFSNGAKLVIIVLSFFLALTFVRAFTLETNTNEVVFAGNQAVVFPLAITNPSSKEMTYAFSTNGPFTVTSPNSFTVSARDTQTVDLTLQPSSMLKVGDVYAGQLRVTSAGETKTIPLVMRMVRGSFISTNTITGFFSAAAFTLPNFSGVSWVDGLLIVVIIILGIALVARVKNRVWGGN